MPFNTSLLAAYVPLARKWRPRTFSDVVGQEEIVRALTNAVSQDRLAHAYLFSGPRGVGKTTSARLLAAAINCLRSEGPTPDPCGACESCVEVLEGRSIDALEIDGATHGKVDQARDLIEVVSYAPVRDRRKVFIIDEVHAISQAAFQALLKTLEEPPSHAVFILATTERHKIPATILSRCQRFDFRRLTDEEVASRLAEIARREGFTVGDDAPPANAKSGLCVERAALASLAAGATGSLRDGLSLFDQAVGRTGGNVTAADVATLLGTPDRTALVSLVGSVLSGDRAAVLRSCAALEAAGAEPRATLHDLTSVTRGLVRLAADPTSTPPAGLSEAGADELARFARETPYQTLLRILSFLLESESTLRRSDVPALAFEVLLLKLTELPRLVPIEELLSGGGLAAAAASLPSSSNAPGVSRVSNVSKAPSEPLPTPAPAIQRVPPPAAVTARETDDSPRFVGLTPLTIEPDPAATPDPGGAFRAAVEKRDSQLGAVLEDASIRIEGKEILVVMDPPNIAAERRLNEPAFAKMLETAAVSILGRGARVRVESATPALGDLTAAAAAADPEALEKENLKKRVAGDERVKKMLDLFGGEITDVRRDEG
jgi:DNA polymerase-3 subunit gamma/tau